MTIFYTLLIINYILSVFFTILIEYGLKLPDEEIIEKTNGKITFEQLRDIRKNWPMGKWILIIPFATILILFSLLF